MTGKKRLIYDDDCAGMAQGAIAALLHVTKLLDSFDISLVEYHCFRIKLSANHKSTMNIQFNVSIDMADFRLPQTHSLFLLGHKDK